MATDFTRLDDYILKIVGKYKGYSSLHSDSELSDYARTFYLANKIPRPVEYDPKIVSNRLTLLQKQGFCRHIGDRKWVLTKQGRDRLASTQQKSL